MSAEDITDIDETIEIYARIISNNTSKNRREIHRRLCQLLGFSYEQFKPFEDSDIKEIPTYNQAKEILKQKIFSFKYIEEKKLCLHCGCCQIKLDKPEDFETHSKTKEHIENAIKVCDKILTDPHDKDWIDKMLKRIDNGEEVEISSPLIILQLRNRFLVERDLQKIREEVR